MGRNVNEDEEPSLAPSEDEEEYEDEESVYDSYEEDEGFEDQGSSDDDEDRLRQQAADDSDDDGVAVKYEETPRVWAGNKRDGRDVIHTEDLSSDDEDEDGENNRIGRVPLHWYDEFDHIGYNVHGAKMAKASVGDRIDQALAMHDNQKNGKFVVHDALNDKEVELTPRQIDLIRRVQAGAYAHPEHDGNPEYIDYYSGVDPQISGLNSNRDPPKARFQPSRWEALQVQRMLRSLERGHINMDYLNGKLRDMNDLNKDDPKAPFGLWSGDEDDISKRKGPQHIAAPKLPPPGHAASYRPPAEYLPTEEELKQWEDMSVKDRPHGSMIPKSFDNLRSVGAYQHSVREAFERCLDLYLCPRVVKKRLNIDPESLVPKLPQAQDLRPFPTAKCILYETPPSDDGVVPMIRCVGSSPDGQFMASGASDGVLRLWEVQTGRLLRSWDLQAIVQPHFMDSGEENAEKRMKPVVCLQWNPTYHVLLAAIGSFIVIVATGTAGADDAELTNALLHSAMEGGSVSSTNRVSKAVTWIPIPENSKDVPIAVSNQRSGPICALRMGRDVADCRWQAKGDYFCTVSPKAGAASVLVHQLSKGNSQQPFSKTKGENQLACFHPNKPFLFVASQQHVRIYHLVKQTMVKRLITGCRWISSMDIHSSGDHLIVGSLDRRVLWFDLDLGATPYKTLKYHERAVRSCRYARRYPLMASTSDDGVVHVFHSMVYNDLMKNPLIVPVKILRGHEQNNKLGVLACSWHPTQPWIFTAGADGKIFLFQDI